MENEKTKTYILKLTKPHPKKYMNLQEHKVTHTPTAFELTASEVKELKSVGGKVWFKVCEKAEVIVVKKSK